MHSTVFVHPDAQLGEAVVLGPNVYVGRGAIVGDAVVIDSGVHVGDGVRVGKRVCIGANAVLVSSLRTDAASPQTVIEDDASIGANATLLAGVSIGARAMVRPGSVVTRPVPPTAIVEGNPAAIDGYVDASIALEAARSRLPSGGYSVAPTVVRGVTAHAFPLIRDLRGDLTVGEFGQHVPFAARRFFMVFGVPNREIRGEHAHRVCHQFLICVRGSCSVVADDGTHRVEIALDAPNRGVYLPPMTWAVQYRYSPDALLLVFASDPYDPSDYIRDYAEFLSLVSNSGAAAAAPIEREESPD